MKLATHEHINKLDTIEISDLVNLMRAEYVASKHNDVEFAAYATRKLEFTVTTANVYFIRHKLKLPANQPKFSAPAGSGGFAQMKADFGAAMELISELSSRVGACEDEIDVLRERAGLSRVKRTRNLTLNLSNGAAGH